MLPFRKIVFAVDFSEACRAIVPHVIEITKRNGADLSLVHAFERFPMAYAPPGMGELTLPTEAEVQGAAEDHLASFAEDLFPGIRLNRIVCADAPVQGIGQVVRHQGADLLMMPTHGRGTFRRMLLGSVTAKLLHDLDCAIWTGVHVREPEYEPHVPYQRIFCAVDLENEESEGVLRAGAALARSYGAKLMLINVVEPPPIGFEVDYSGLLASTQSAADKQLRELRTALGIEAEIHAVSGPLSGTIRALAHQQRADLIVLGRGHAQGRFSRIWSHLYEIVREAPCPCISL